MLIGFIYQLRRSYDEWVARAFPHDSREVLTETTNRLEHLRLEVGATILQQGDVADRFYIIAAGEGVVTRRAPSGRDVELARLRPGQYFGEIGLLTNVPRTASVRAATDVELLALEREEFRAVVSSSEATAEDVGRVVRQRLASANAARCRRFRCA